MERLQKVIANLGYTSRRKAEELIQAGKVKVNGEIVKELGTKVKTSDTIEVENTILDKSIQSDVLKVGHHGSKTSTSNRFLEKVNPKYAVISVGKGNSYSHPNIETLNRLAKKDVKVYRTDEFGTIIAKSNGTIINFENVKTNTNG